MSPALKYWDSASSTWKVGAVGNAAGQYWVQPIGDGVATSFEVVHGLGTRYVTVSVYRSAPPYEEVQADVERTMTDRITVRTAPTVPGVGEFTVVVQTAGVQAALNTQMDTWHIVGNPGEPAFQGSPLWANFDTPAPGARLVRFRKFPDGRVRLTGLAKGGTGQIFMLPVGYRPSSDLTFPVNSNAAFGVLAVDAAGGVRLPLGSSVFVDLSGVEFDTESVTQQVVLGAQPIESWHIVGDPGEPQYLNNWGALDSIRQLPSFRRMPDGTVHLKGTMKSNVNQSGQTIALYLPPGYRPSREMWFWQPGSAGGGPSGRIEIAASGGVNVVPVAASGTSISLDGINFIGEDFPIGAYASGFMGPPLVSALPANPVDGQECYYQNGTVLVDGTNTMAQLGIAWHLRYRAASSSAYKWEAIGPTAVYVEYNPQNSHGASYTLLSPYLTLPLAGDYDIEYGGYLTNGTTSNWTALNIGIGAAPSDDNGALWEYQPGGMGSRQRRLSNLAINSAVQMYGKGQSGSAPYSQNRWLRLIPVRVG